MIKQYYKLVVVLSILFLTGVYFLFLSDNGILERLRIKVRIERIEDEIENLKVRNIRLKDLYGKYKSGYQDEKDILHSGYMKKDDTLLLFKDNQNLKNGLIEERDSAEYYGAGLKYLRIAWIILSMCVLAILFIKRPKKVDD